jgi:hypothetical protein
MIIIQNLNRQYNIRIENKCRLIKKRVKTCRLKLIFFLLTFLMDTNEPTDTKHIEQKNINIFYIFFFLSINFTIFRFVFEMK